MNRSVPLIALAALSLAACKKADVGPESPPQSKPPAATATDGNDAKQAVTTAPAERMSASDAASDRTVAESEAPPASPTPPMLAMAYKVGLVVPAAQVRPLMESHQEACERAGEDQCQVLSANASASHDDRAEADLSLRATPAWMRLFRDRAEADAKDLGGKVDMAATEGEDLSRQIVDTDAAQQTRAAERERLQQLMSHRTRDLDQTLQVEQEITRVQGEMDQAASEEAAMKDRVAMETLGVHYASPAMAAPDGAAAPLAEASRSFLGNVFAVFAAMVVLASFALPVLLVVIPIAWWVSRRRKARMAQPRATPAA